MEHDWKRVERGQNNIVGKKQVDALKQDDK